MMVLLIWLLRGGPHHWPWLSLHSADLGRRGVQSCAKGWIGIGDDSASVGSLVLHGDRP